MPFHTGVFGNGTIYLTPPATVPNGTRAYVYILGQDEDPVSFYRRLVLLEPEDATLYTQLGTAQFNAGKLIDAEASLSRAVQLDYGFAAAHLNLGRCYDAQNQLESAAHSYRAASELDPQDGTAARYLIMTLVRLGQIDNAFEALYMAQENSLDLLGWAAEEESLAPLREDERWAALV